MKYQLPRDPSEASAVAKLEELSNEQLEALATSDLPFLREAAAAHPRSSPEILSRLLPSSLEGEVEMRIAVAMSDNPGAPSSLLGQLLSLLDSAVLDGSRRECGGFERLAIQILMHPNCPTDSGIAVINRSGRALRLRMATEVKNPAFLLRLAADQSEAVVSAANQRLAVGGA